MRILYLLFFVSGISGLVYQIIWIRQFGNLFGNTVHSASLVTAVFMLGLGVGSYCLGRWTDRATKGNNRKNIFYYGAFEIALAILGLLLALLFPHLEGLSSSLSTYVRAENGWYELSFASSFSKYVLASVLILPSAFLMGGTLPLLIRFSLHGHLDQSAARVGRLYGMNTLGAAVGALLVDFFLIPHLGLFGSQGIASFLNLVAGLGALKIKELEASKANEVPRAVAGKYEFVPVIAAVFIAGFVGMGLEIIWFRFLSGIIGSYRTGFSLLIFVILLGMWLGASLGGTIAASKRGPGQIFALSQSLLVVVAVVSVFVFNPAWSESPLLKRAFLASPDPIRHFIEILSLLKIHLLVAFVPSICMGITYPIANALIQNTESAIGRRAGGLYFANTFGGVLGSLIAGFVLIPLIGIQNAFTALALIGCAGVALMAREKRVAVIACPVLAAFATLAFPAQFLTHKMFTKNESKNAEFIKISEGPNEVLAIARDESAQLLLLTNGHKMSGTTWGDQRYMGAFSHMPLLQQDEPSSILVICFGVGNTLYSASLHGSLKNLHVVDFSKNVLNHHMFFKDFNHGVLSDPRIKVFVNDGRQHLRMRGDSAINYDLITLEPPPLAYAGVSALYTKEFYEMARSRLNEGGYVTQWLPINQVPKDVGLQLVRAFVEVFPDSVLLNGYYNNLMLMGRKGGGIQFDRAKFLKNLESRPEVKKHMGEILFGDMNEVIGSFISGAKALKSATQNSEPMSDNRPTMEYSHIAFLHHDIPLQIFNLDTLGDWCADCQSPQLDTYMAILKAWYVTSQFRRYSSVEEIQKEQLKIPKSAGDVPAAIRDSKYLTEVFGKPSK